MMLFGGAVLWVISFLMGFPFLGASMVFMIVYVWSRRESEAPVSIWGFKMKGLYLPWALMAFSILIGNSPVMDILGVVAGHVYYFLLEVVPNPLIQTPQFLINMFPSARTISTTGGRFTAAAPVNAPKETKGPARHTWGSGGRALGSS